MPAAQQPKVAVHLRDKPSHGRLPRPGIAREDYVVCHLGRLQPLLLAHLADADQADQRVDLLLDGLLPDEPVQLGYRVASHVATKRPRLARADQAHGTPAPLAASAVDHDKAGQDAEDTQDRAHRDHDRRYLPTAELRHHILIVPKSKNNK